MFLDAYKGLLEAQESDDFQMQDLPPDVLCRLNQRFLHPDPDTPACYVCCVCGPEGKRNVANPFRNVCA